MAAPFYVGAGTGSTDAGGAWSYSIAGSSGNFFIFQLLQDGSTTTAVAITSVGSDISNIAGTASAVTEIFPTGNPFGVGASDEALMKLWCGRLTGTSSVLISGSNSTSEDLYMRSYIFSNVSVGATLATVIENATAGATVNSKGTSATASDASVTTLGPDRLALNFVAINDDDVVNMNHFTGETGGDWNTVETYSDAGGTDGCIALQSASMPTAGTIDGGTASIVVSDAWGVVGFALIGATVAPTDILRRYPMQSLIAQ